MKFLLLTLSLIALFTANGQTQKESQDWILSKINKYKEPSYSASDDISFTSKITKVSFVDCKFEIIITNEGTRKTNGKNENFKTTSTITIPITKLTKMNYNMISHQIMLETENENISWATNDPKFPANNLTNYVKFYGFKVNLNTEKDLSDRMSEAFKHLISKYCNKEETSKEAF